MSRFGGKGMIIQPRSPAQANSYLITPDDRTSRNPLAPALEKIYVPEEEMDWRNI